MPPCPKPMYLLIKKYKVKPRWLSCRVWENITGIMTDSLKKKGIWWCKLYKYMPWKLFQKTSGNLQKKVCIAKKKSLDGLFQQQIIVMDVKHFTSDVHFTSTWEYGYLSRSHLCIDRKLHDSSSHHTRRCHHVYLPSHQRDPHHSSYTLHTHTFLRTKTKTLYIHTLLSPHYVKINFVN